MIFTKLRTEFLISFLIVEFLVALVAFGLIHSGSASDVASFGEFFASQIVRPMFQVFFGAFSFGLGGLWALVTPVSLAVALLFAGGISNPEKPGTSPPKWRITFLAIGSLNIANIIFEATRRPEAWANVDGIGAFLSVVAGAISIVVSSGWVLRKGTARSRVETDSCGPPSKH